MFDTIGDLIKRFHCPLSGKKERKFVLLLFQMNSMELFPQCKTSITRVDLHNIICDDIDRQTDRHADDDKFTPQMDQWLSMQCVNSLSTDEKEFLSWSV